MGKHKGNKQTPSQARYKIGNVREKNKARKMAKVEKNMIRQRAKRKLREEKKKKCSNCKWFGLENGVGDCLECGQNGKGWKPKEVDNERTDM